MNLRPLLPNEPTKARSKSRYLAALNIKRALPNISDQTHIPDFFKDHKVHAGPFLWLARDGHYEYTHFDPDEGCLIIIEGKKQVRLFDSTDPSLLKPNKYGSMGRTIQSSIGMVSNMSLTSKSSLHKCRHQNHLGVFVSVLTTKKIWKFKKTKYH